jgi:hypothetical protein
MKISWQTSTSIAAFSLLFFSFTRASLAQNEPTSDGQLVRVSYVEGDVRFNRGDHEGINLQKPWKRRK